MSIIKLAAKVLLALFGFILLIIATLLIVYGPDTMLVMSTMDKYMQAMRDGDTQTAYSLLAIRTKTETSVVQLQEILTINAKAYTGYEKICLGGIQFDPYYPLISDSSYPPAGKIVQIDTCITYKDGLNKVGGATAYLEKEYDGWRILLIHPVAVDKK
jgi:hypothetical protein